MSDFYNKYPYTDFHELNLDWVIERVKKLTEDWAATLTEWNNTEEEWHQLYDYVHDYFNNLDVQQEINNKIDQMILDGTFATIATPIIENQVIITTTAWLADHITQPTTPVVDNTFTISGAAADSKTVGDKCYRAGNLFISSGNVSTYNDMDTMPANQMILVSSGVATSAYIDHLPIENDTFWSIYERSSSNDDTGIQMAWTRSGNQFFYRNKHTSLGWNPWQRIPMLGDSVVSTNITVTTSNVSNYDDLDNYPINSFIGISSAVSTSSYIDHLPEQNTTMFVRTNSYNLSSMNGIQYVYTMSGHIYFRLHLSSWSSWTKLTTIKDDEFYAAGNLFISSGNVATYNDMDTMPKNRMILISSGVATSAYIDHLPIENDTFWSIYERSSSNDDTGIQMAWTRSGNQFFYRNKHTSLGWNPWQRIPMLGDSVVSTNITVTTSNVSNYDDLDNYPINSFIGISSAVSTSSYIDHLPEQNTTMFVRTNSYNLSSMNGIQYVYTMSGHIYFRLHLSSWSSWTKLTTIKDDEFYAAGNLFISSGNVATYNDMDTMPKNRMILISSGVATSAYISHLPVESQTIWSIYMLEDNSSNNGIQMAWTRDTDAFYYRNRHSSLGWNEWSKISTVLDKVRYPIHTCIDKTLDFTNKGMYIFGDSVTTSSHGGFTWGSIVATKLNNTEYNYGVGGAYYYGGANTIKAQIDGVSDWSNADIVFLCGGVNDCINQVGSGNFKSAVATAIDTVKTNAPGAIIIVVSPLYTEWQNKQYFNIENYAAALCNIALSKECNFINGFDIPIALETNAWVSEQVDNDGMHPNATGKKIYAQGIINALS